MSFAEDVVPTSLAARVSLDPSLISGLRGKALAIRLTVSDVEFERIERDGTLFSSVQSLRLAPDIILMWGQAGIGFAIGYEPTFEGEMELNVLKTTSEYMVNERRFTSRTDLNLDYRMLKEERLTVHAGKRIRGIELGCRLSLQRQILKKGRIISEMKLTAEHGEDINPNDPRQLIPAIVDGLRYSINREDRPERDESGLGLNADLAIGIRPKIVEGLRVAMIFRNLLFPQMPRPSHAGLTLYGVWMPRGWLEIEIGTEKLLSERPRSWFGFRLTADHEGIGSMLSGGWISDRDGTKKAVVGLDLILGGNRFGLSALIGGSAGVTIFQEHRF
jgi:hypothetical protein